jgi:hypothetical protein
VVNEEDEEEVLKESLSLSSCSSSWREGGEEAAMDAEEGVE